MNTLKKVPVLESFRYGYIETKKHFKKLLPLSALFFLPELLLALGWKGQSQHIFSEAYKIAAFFFLLISAMRLTKPGVKAAAVQAEGVEFLKGNAIKWSAMALAFVLGGAVLLLVYLAISSPALALFSGGSPWAGAMAYGEWFLSRPHLEQAWSGAILGYLPYRVFVMFNFFGYVIVETGVGAVESLKTAKKIASGVFWPLSLFYALCGVFHIVGYKLYIVGSVFTFPITVLATVYIYRSLAEQSREGI